MLCEQSPCGIWGHQWESLHSTFHSYNYHTTNCFKTITLQNSSFEQLLLYRKSVCMGVHTCHCEILGENGILIIKCYNWRPLKDLLRVELPSPLFLFAAFPSLPLLCLPLTFCPIFCPNCLSCSVHSPHPSTHFLQFRIGINYHPYLTRILHENLGYCCALHRQSKMDAEILQGILMRAQHF